MEERVLNFYENYDKNFINLQIIDDLIPEDKKIIGNINTTEGQLQLGYNRNCKETIPKFREFLEKEEKKRADEVGGNIEDCIVQEQNQRFQDFLLPVLKAFCLYAPVNISSKLTKEQIITEIKKTYTPYEIYNFIIDFNLETNEDVADFMISYKSSLLQQRAEKAEEAKQKKRGQSLLLAEQDEEEEDIEI